MSLHGRDFHLKASWLAASLLEMNSPILLALQEEDFGIVTFDFGTLSDAAIKTTKTCQPDCSCSLGRKTHGSLNSLQLGR